MTDLKRFDHYSFRARLQPALLSLLPLAFAAIAWTEPGARWLSALWTLFGTAGGTFFLATLARNRGRSLEADLWSSWGGAPTTQMLRHRGPANPLLRARWHEQLSKLIQRKFPTAEEEDVAPEAADAVYQAATRLLIDKTRDIQKFPLIYKENVSYGFCRNLFGLRAIGLTTSIVGTVAGLGAGVWYSSATRGNAIPWVCAAASLLFLMWWLTTVKASWVKQPAFAYAERLLECSDKFGRSKTK